MTHHRKRERRQQTRVTGVGQRRERPEDASTSSERELTLGTTGRLGLGVFPPSPVLPITNY